MGHEAAVWLQRPGTALVVVDMQNDFVDPRGALAVPGAMALLAPINALILAARTAHAPIAWTMDMDWHPAQTGHFQPWGGPWPVHGVAHTWGASLHPDLLSVDGLCFKKGLGQEDGYSGFMGYAAGGGAGPWDHESHGTCSLGAWLGQHAVQAVVIVGVATEHCVAATASDALKAGLAVVIPLDCCAAVDQAAGRVALARLRQRGAVLLEKEGQGGLPRNASDHAGY